METSCEAREFLATGAAEAELGKYFPGGLRVSRRLPSPLL